MILALSSCHELCVQKDLKLLEIAFDLEADVWAWQSFLSFHWSGKVDIDTKYNQVLHK